MAVITIAEPATSAATSDAPGNGITPQQVESRQIGPKIVSNPLRPHEQHQHRPDERERPGEIRHRCSRAERQKGGDHARRETRRQHSSDRARPEHRHQILPENRPRRPTGGLQVKPTREAADREPRGVGPGASRRSLATCARQGMLQGGLLERRVGPDHPDDMQRENAQRRPESSEPGCRSRCGQRTHDQLDGEQDPGERRLMGDRRQCREQVVGSAGAEGGEKVGDRTPQGPHEDRYSRDRRDEGDYSESKPRRAMLDDGCCVRTRRRCDAWRAS